MQNSSLLKILGTFTAEEMKQFKDFICSPFFNKNENVKKLFNYLRKFHPEFTDKRLGKEYVHKKLFGGENYTGNFLRTVSFNLSRLAEEFLSVTRITKDDFKKKLSLLEEYNERKLGKNFLRLHEQMTREIEDKKTHDAEYFLTKYRLQMQMEIYLDWSRYMQKDLKSYSESFSSANQNLTYFFLIKMLNHYRFLYDKYHWFPIDLDTGFADNAVNFLTEAENKFVNNPKIRLHLYEILLHRDKKHEHFLILKQMLEDSKVLSKSERYSLHNILQSYCTRQFFSGKDEYLRERYYLYKTAMDQGHYAAPEHLYMDDLLFINSVSIASQCGDHDWANEMMNNFKKFLSEENKESVIILSNARLCFEKKKFQDANELIGKIRKIKHIQFKFPLKDISLMIAYELSDLTSMSFQIDSYRHFIKNNRSLNSDERNERIENFLRFITRLFRLREKPDKQQAVLLEEELSRTPNTMERRWLALKISEIKD